MNKFIISFRRDFIAGLLALLPLWLTLVIVWLIFSWVSGLTAPILMPVFRFILGREISWMLIRLVSFFLTIVFIWFIGAIATHIVGRRFLLGLEGMVTRLPVLRDIYFSARKFIQYFTREKSFQKAVLVEFPRVGIHSIGFITREAATVIKGRAVTSVFVPTTPNVTTGFFILVPHEELTELSMSIDEAFKLIISGGIVVPDQGIVPPPGGTQ